MIRPVGIKENTFKGNKADYGENFASFPAYIKAPDALQMESVASGQSLPFSLAFTLLDFDKQVIINDNTSYGL